MKRYNEIKNYKTILTVTGQEEKGHRGGKNVRIGIRIK